MTGSLMHDIRLAVRSLRATPVVSIVAALSPALGIGANTAIFSLVDSLVLRTLPVADPSRLVVVNDAGVTSPGIQSWTFAIWDNIPQRAQPFDGAFAFGAPRFNLAQDGEQQLVDGLYVSGQYFSTLGVPPLLGRTLTEKDDVCAGGWEGWAPRGYHLPFLAAALRGGAPRRRAGDRRRPRAVHHRRHHAAG